MALLETGKNEEALVYFAKALELDAQDARAWSNKGLLLAKMGKQEEALLCYDNALQIDTDHVPDWSEDDVPLSGTPEYAEAEAKAIGATGGQGQ
jgi:tetratricopeptide (TPR) repeat protein